jgi:hypothetical protein
MPAESQYAMRCPTCGARQAWADTCRRCKCNLRLLRAAAAAYERHHRRSLQLLNAGAAELALPHARSCHLLNPGTESNRLMALCYFVQENWKDAVESAQAVVDKAAAPSN